MKSTPSAATSEAKAPRLRVGLKDVDRAEFATAVRERLGKQRVSIMLDGEVLAFFRAKAGERGYQTLINQALREAMASERLETTLRRVIREEMRSA
ncbi:BrnA antitoxin family protein [Comamonas sp. NLF-1-9]|uniref:BrnA antitoxin family protein n=1 Tax=Comamonas sp. NLF-1-9 TaxID=2853163 RepID=UPI001C44DE7E|nr:BrnA antitoxin family protein [Comamonas sp. NLF-1-9]QXL83407.1 BrnA antitoxin family protein [Comamonas sp. NLF-1-9]